MFAPLLKPVVHKTATTLQTVADNKDKELRQSRDLRGAGSLSSFLYTADKHIEGFYM